MTRKFLRSVNGQKGQGMAEYALIIALIVIALVSAVRLFGPALSGHYQGIQDSFTP